MGDIDRINMSSYATADSKKEEFRKFLEKSGVIDALTKVLVRMYEEPERPQQALDFIKQYLGASVGVDHEAMKQKIDEQDREITQLREEKAKLAQELEEAKAAAAATQ